MAAAAGSVKLGVIASPHTFKSGKRILAPFPRNGANSLSFDPKKYRIEGL
jgi:hypothetical protein